MSPFVCFSSWTCRSVGEGKQAKVMAAPHALGQRTDPSRSPFQPSFPVLHSRGSLSFFIFLFSSRYSHKLLLGEKKEQDVRGSSEVGVCRSRHVSAGEPHGLPAREQSVSWDTHGSGSSGWKGMVREKQASL